MTWVSVAGFVFGLLVVFFVGFLFGPSKELKELKEARRKAELAQRDAWNDKQQREKKR
jgi:membrane protein DedA with SNARE-associated domain